MWKPIISHHSNEHTPTEYGWYPSIVLIISPTVLMVSPHSTKTPKVLMIFLHTTEHPLQYGKDVPKGNDSEVVSSSPVRVIFIRVNYQDNLNATRIVAIVSVRILLHFLPGLDEFDRDVLRQL